MIEIRRTTLITAALGLLFATCKKDTTHIYEVADVTVRQPGTDKSSVKSTTEFISIAYSDLFGTTIGNAELVDLSVSYAAFGDKKLIEDMIIRNFLNKPGAAIPARPEMTADPEGFVSATYKKFYNREPNEYETWYLKDLISKDTTVTPELIYYAVMTSNEYRYY